MATVPDPDLEIGGEGGGVVSKTFLRPFGPQFGLKIRGKGQPPWICHWARFLQTRHVS